MKKLLFLLMFLPVLAVGQEYWLQKKFYFVGNKKHGLFNLGQ